MAQVSVPVNGRSYAITCDDGQETRIRRLAQYVDAKVAEFVGSVGNLGHRRVAIAGGFSRCEPRESPRLLPLRAPSPA